MKERALWKNHFRGEVITNTQIQFITKPENPLKILLEICFQLLSFFLRVTPAINGENHQPLQKRI